MTRVPFDEMPWVAGSHPLERKKTSGALTLLEFAPGFADPNWCSRTHVFFILEGRLVVEYADGSEVVASSGQSILIGPKMPHRARNDGANATRLFVVSDLVFSDEVDVSTERSRA